MRVCMPITDDSGMTSLINKDFETASKYIICELDTDTSFIVGDQDMKDVFGESDPLGYLAKVGVESIVTPDMRPASRVVLKRRTSISIFQGEGVVCDALDMLQDGKLLELGLEGLEFSTACAGSCSSCSSSTCS